MLTVGGLAGLLVQVPGGELLDMVRSKRPLVALGVVTIACSALILAVWPSYTPALVAELLLGVTGGFLGPAVSAISLGLVGINGMPERLGRNQRFAAIGGFATAGLMGLLGYLFSNQLIFFASAALAVPTLAALGWVRADDIHFARACGAPAGDYHPARPPRSARKIVGTSHHLLIFASCIVLFQLANASVLPLVGEELGRERGSPLVISALTWSAPDYRRPFGSESWAGSGKLGASPAVAYWARRVADPCRLSRARRRSPVVDRLAGARRYQRGCDRRADAIGHRRRDEGHGTVQPRTGHCRNVQRHWRRALARRCRAMPPKASAMR